MTYKVKLLSEDIDNKYWKCYKCAFYSFLEYDIIPLYFDFNIWDRKEEITFDKVEEMLYSFLDKVVKFYDCMLYLEEDKGMDIEYISDRDYQYESKDIFMHLDIYIEKGSYSMNFLSNKEKEIYRILRTINVQQDVYSSSEKESYNQEEHFKITLTLDLDCNSPDNYRDIYYKS